MIINTGWRKQRKEDRKMHHRLAIIFLFSFSPPLTSVIFENDVSWSLHILQTRMRTTRATVTRPAVSAGLLLVLPWQWLLLCVHH